MIRRVIVDLMLALFATLFAVAIASNSQVGNQPKSKGFIVIRSLESDKKQSELSIISPSGDSPRQMQVIPGMIDGDDKIPRVYMIFPAEAGAWRIRHARGIKVSLLTRSGKTDPDIPSVAADPNGYPVEVEQ
jgi:hypothetical protein